MHRLFIFLFICLAALGAGVYVSFPDAHFAIGSFGLLQPKPEEPQQLQKTKIRFVGDVMLARHVEFLMDEYGSSYPTALLPEHPDDSYLVGNFESAIPAVHVPTKSMTFSFATKEENAIALSSYGFTHLGLANNHAYDFGLADFKHTAQVLSSSFTAFGDPGSLGTSSVTTLSLGSTTVALVAVYAVHTSPSAEDIAASFAYARAISDVQIAYVHWGEEYMPTHNKSQERLAHALVDAGADAVIGHHPHVIQDVGLYNGVPIFYSIGNFIFDQFFSVEVQNGLLLELSVFEERLDFVIHPVTSVGSRTQPRFASAYERNAQLSDLAKKSDPALSLMLEKGIVSSAF